MFSVPPRGCLQWKQASFLKASPGPPNKEEATLEKEERLPETMVVECMSGGGGLPLEPKAALRHFLPPWG